MNPSSIVSALASALLVLPASNGSARAADASPARYATPPAIGSRLMPQSGLFRCDDPASARSSAETGFLARGCVRVERGDTWRVVRCIETTLSHGPLRLLELISSEGETAWTPLPWHDWA